MHLLKTRNSQTSSKKYDVFLSFRGEDTRYGITSHIYRALDSKKIKTYIDDKCLERGDEITPALLAAIEGSRIAVVVFSKDYASSSWCLSELVHIHKCRREFGQVVLPIFFEVDPSHVRKQDRGSYRDSFKKHEMNPKHTAKTINEWRSALKSSADLSGSHYSRSNSLAMFRAESALVDDLVNSVLNTLNRPAMPVDIDHFDGLVGMGKHFRKITSLLMTGSPELQIVGIWGMAGVGKTTIAEAVSSRLFREFESYYFLKNVRESSEKHGLESLRDGLISRLLGDDNLDSGSSLPSQITDHAKERLLRTKVLLVLDDVSDKGQLEYLVGGHIGNGSRVIVTTRDEGVLRGSDIVRASFEKYEVKVLRFEEALVLFSLTAFREKSPPVNYEDVSKQVVKYVGSNPLAIKVFGSQLRSLRNPCRDNWEMELDKLKECSHGDIMKKLRISYDVLGETEQKIFLDIACFFKGMQREFVQSILNGCGFFATTGIDDLIDKSLITLDPNDMLNMHDLMQQLGWQIIRRESQEPGNRSRLWIAKHAYHVFENDTGSALIEGISLNNSKLEEFLHLKARGFQRMINLRLLTVNGNRRYETPKLKVEPLECFPKSLRYLLWKGYPLKSLPSGFSPRYLVVIELIYTQLEQLWHGTQNLDNLKAIDLSNSSSLSQLPDLSRAPNLETIILENCISLLEVPWDVFGKLNRLSHLDLSLCEKLGGFPESIDSSGLKTLQLQGCPELKIVPRIVSASLVTLNLSSTAITSVPSSIGFVSTISELFIHGCKSLVSLPRSISQLHLKTFDLSGCSSLEEFPELPKNITELAMSNSAVKEVPSSSIASCSLLQKISFRCSKRLESLPGSLFDLSSLVSLDLSHCSALMKLPEILKTNTVLEQLHMDETGIECFPSSIGNLKNLKELRLTSCKNLVSVDDLSGSQLTDLLVWGSRKIRCISGLPFTLKHLNATGCISLEEVVLVPFGSEKTRKTFWDLSRKVMFHTFDFALFSDCFRLNQRSQDNLLTGIQLKVLHMALDYYTAAKCKVKIPPAITVCFPGSNIPYWFDLHCQDSGSRSSSVMFSLSEDEGILGFALCVIAGGSFTLSTNVFCEIEFKEKDEARVETSIVCSAFVGPERSMVIPSSLMNYVVMWYKHWDYNHLNGRALEASFRFSVAERGNYPASCSAPAKCGVHIVRAKDLKDLDLINDNNDEIGRSSDADLIESSGMMIVDHSTQSGGENSRSNAWKLVSAILLCCYPEEKIPSEH